MNGDAWWWSVMIVSHGKGEQQSLGQLSNSTVINVWSLAVDSNCPGGSEGGEI